MSYLTKVEEGTLQQSPDQYFSTVYARIKARVKNPPDAATMKSYFDDEIASRVEDMTPPALRTPQDSQGRWIAIGMGALAVVGIGIAILKR
jgi:hypothetical protein